MIRSAREQATDDRLAADAEAWDDALRATGGHLLQSWHWGALKSRFGWEPERVAVATRGGAALAQILFRTRAGVSIGYIPRGPALPENDPEAAVALWREIDRVARRRRALTVIVEHDAEIDDDIARRLRLTPGPAAIQPARTVKVRLGSDDELLKQMHQKTRYNVRLAQRRGVLTREAAIDDASIDGFYALMQDTASRNEFGIHSRDYYGEFLRLFADRGLLLFAEIEGRPVAAVAAVAFGDEAIYMYGASSTKDRAHGAGFLLQYEAMRWARERGCAAYDLWGIPAEDPESTRVEDGGRIAGTSGSDWRGLYEFKTRFGGEILRYPAPLERLYHPLLASLARRVYSLGGGAA
ncbi:MAG: peptidoglycan bridge formation glycyltransferase FemA/FemB family protein [Thermomicrobiales bacterium]|nr:peptidoglycan bridge formation glycyltransferase FemA/FemB family protein [Thermomicrobiales bacterium]